MNAHSPPEKTHYIQGKLAEAARQNNVKILLAVESGSRAWGFPSSDSDHDVRFIYSRNIQDYLAVEPIRDVIETDLSDDAFLEVPLDLNGWDVRKALQLALKSNAVVVEWLVSPIVYMADEDVVAKLRQFTFETADLQVFEYHYDHLARHALADISQSQDPVKLKKYFYALRPALALTWLRQFGKLAPMNIIQIMERLELPDNLRGGIRQLIDDKANAIESDKIDRRPVLDTFLEQSLTGKTLERPERPSVGPTRLREANDLFLDIIR